MGHDEARASQRRCYRAHCKHVIDDPQPVVDQYGLRNQDIDGAAQIWSFFSN